MYAHKKIFALLLTLIMVIGIMPVHIMGSPLVAVPEGRVAYVSAGGNSTFAIMEDGSLWAWGNNNLGGLPAGRLGLGGTYTDGQFNLPTRVGNSYDWYSVSAGYMHTIAMQTDGSLWGWGMNLFGRVGTGATMGTGSIHASPARIGNGYWLAAAAGGDFTIAIADDGTLWAWGSNQSGQLGQGGGASASLIPLQPMTIYSDWVYVAAGSSYALAVRANGEVWGFGENVQNQLAETTFSAPQNGRSVNLPSHLYDGDNFARVFAGGGFDANTTFETTSSSWGIKNDGTLWFWGYLHVENRTLPSASADDPNVPNQMRDTSVIGSGLTWEDVAIGTPFGTTARAHVLAIDNAGQLFAGGNGAEGRLGRGNTTSTNHLERVGTDSDWIMVSAGSSHSMGIRRDGSLWGWGRNTEGQLGDGTTTNRLVPVEIIGGVPMASITSITPTAATATFFENIPVAGVSHQYAEFNVAGENLDLLAIDNFITAPNPGAWLSPANNWQNYADFVANPTGTSAVFTIPYEILPNTGAQRGPVYFRITYDLGIHGTNGGSVGELRVIQRAFEPELPPTITSIVPTATTLTALEDIVINGATIHAQFLIEGANFTASNMTAGDFILTGLPIWVTAGISSISIQSATIAHLTVQLTVSNNDTGTTREALHVIVSNAITPTVDSGQFPVSQTADPTPVTYTVTIVNNPAGTMTGQSGAGAYEAGATVHLVAGTRTGYNFVSWTSTPNIISTNQPNASFTMPSNNVTVTANWTAIPQTVHRVTNISLSPLHWQTNTVFPLNYHTAISTSHPSTAGDFTITWSIPSNQPFNPATGVTLAGDSLNATGSGAVRVLATIPNGLGAGEDFTRDFVITFSSEIINVSIEGLENLFTGQETNGRVLFTLANGVFADEITPNDFTIGRLPFGLRAGEATRISDTVVAVPIYGAPSRTSHDENETYLLFAPTTIPPRNIRNSNFPVGVNGRDTLLVGPVGNSAVAMTGSIIFDLNPSGELHRDVHIGMDLRQALRGVFYGSVELEDGVDFTRSGSNFTIHRSFLSRLPEGAWDLTFEMRIGANPTVAMIIIDTTNDLAIIEPPVDPGPAPMPPPMLPQPDMNFMYLTGNVAIDVNTLPWDIGLARVNPSVMGGQATLTVRAHVLDYLSWRMPNQGFEAHTHLARLNIPTDVLDMILGGRSAIINSGLLYDQVDVRFSLIDRSDVEAHNNMFHSVYPYGQILSPLVELRVEFINAVTDEVFFTAQEFTRPMDMTFVIMGTGSHIRPGGMFFHPQRIEFAPYRAFTANEITTRSIFTGVHGIVHNNAFFEDIPRHHWGFEQAYTAAYSALVANVGNLNFNAVTTRGEFVQLLANALQLPRAAVATSGFADIPQGHAFYDGISRANHAGLLGLWDSDNFSPNTPISRQEMAAIVGTATSLGTPVRQAEFVSISGAFLDSAQFSGHHLPAIQQAMNFSIVSGHPDSTFRPLESATRIEALEAVINLARVMGLLD
ncbi:MAG: S-layer homology domain-containing protein [Defluviitaleaceae bacterium]|nr:S-layer homology domain-containing protein [Defluviitaleaceae bacterium]